MSIALQSAMNFWCFFTMLLRYDVRHFPETKVDCLHRFGKESAQRLAYSEANPAPKVAGSMKGGGMP